MSPRWSASNMVSVTRHGEFRLESEREERVGAHAGKHALWTQLCQEKTNMERCRPNFSVGLPGQPMPAPADTHNFLNTVGASSGA